MNDTPETIRLRSGIEVVNGITGETAPTFSEYVLLSDYQELQRELTAAQAACAEAERRAERLKFYAKAMVKRIESHTWGGFVDPLVSDYLSEFKEE